MLSHLAILPLLLVHFIDWRFQRMFPIYFFMTAHVLFWLESGCYFRIKNRLTCAQAFSKRIKQKYFFLVCNSLYCKQNWNDLSIHTTYSLSVSLPPLENNSFHFLSLGAGTVLRNFPVEMCIILSNLLLVYCVGKFDHVQCPN